MAKIVFNSPIDVVVGAVVVIAFVVDAVVGLVKVVGVVL